MADPNKTTGTKNTLAALTAGNNADSNTNTSDDAGATKQADKSQEQIDAETAGRPWPTQQVGEIPEKVVPSTVDPQQITDVASTHDVALMDTAPRGDTELRMQSTGQQDYFEANPKSMTIQERVQGAGASLLEMKQEAEGDEEVFYFRRDDVREFIVAGFHFHNHILKIVGRKEYERFMHVMRQMPDYDLAKINVYKPQLLAEIEKPLNETIFRGIAGSGQYTDARTVQGRAPIGNM